MSQHLFTAKTNKGQAVAVRCGWDRPLRHYFLDICAEHDEDDILYDSLHMPGGGITHYELFEQLRAHGITSPRGLELVLDDEMRGQRETNVVVQWPLADKQQQYELDARIDRSIIESALCNDEESSDKQLVKELLPQLTTIDKPTLKRLIKQERGACLTELFHNIDWDDYRPEESAS